MDPGARESKGQIGAEVSPPRPCVLHLPLSGGDAPLCLEIPEIVLSTRNLLWLLARHAPFQGLHRQPAWRMAAGLQAALESWQKGEPDELARLILRDPFVLQDPGVSFALAEDLDSRRFKLLTAIWNSQLRTRVDPTTLEFHRRVSVLRRAAQRDYTNQSALVFERFRPESESLSHKEMYQLAATLRSREGAKHRAERVKKAFQRVDPLAATVPVMVALCGKHLDSGSPVPVEPHPAWAEIQIPSADDLANAKVINWRIFQVAQIETRKP